MSHYYTHDGKPAHTQTIKSGNNKGKQRPTTKRDAAKLNLLPSVSAYTGILAKDWLIRWNVMGALGCAFDAPPIGRENKDEWISHVAAKWEKDKMGPAERGTVLHAEIEEYFTSDSGNIVSAHHAFIQPVIEIVEAMDSPVQHSETVVVCLEHGYAGTADIIHEDGSITDFKSKDFKGRDTVTPSFDHCMQLAAYFYAHNGHADFTTCRNIYFDRQEPGVTMLHEWTPEELRAGWEAFLACCVLYQITTGFDPRRNSESSYARDER